MVPALARRAVAVDGRARDLPEQHAGRSGRRRGRRRAGGGETIPGAGVWRSTDGGDDVDDRRRRGRGDPSNARIHALAAHPTDADRVLGGDRAGRLPHGRRRQHVDAVRSRPAVTRTSRSRRSAATLRLFAVLSGFRRSGPAGAPPRSSSASTSPTTRDARPSTSAILPAVLPAGAAPTPLAASAAPAARARPARRGRRAASPRTASSRSTPAAPPASPIPSSTSPSRATSGRCYGIFRCREPRRRDAGDATDWTRLAAPAGLRRRGPGRLQPRARGQPREPEPPRVRDGRAVPQPRTRTRTPPRRPTGCGPRCGTCTSSTAATTPTTTTSCSRRGRRRRSTTASPAGTMVLWDANDGGVSRARTGRARRPMPIATASSAAIRAAGDPAGAAPARRPGASAATASRRPRCTTSPSTRGCRR